MQIKKKKNPTTFAGVFHSDAVIMGDVTNCLCHWLQSSDKYMAAQPSYDTPVPLRLVRRK